MGGSSSIRVLCVCNNGVDLTAEVDCALEGVVDNGQGNAGAGEAGRIQEGAYSTRTMTVTRTETLPAVTQTTTLTKVVWYRMTTFHNHDHNHYNCYCDCYWDERLNDR